MVERDFFDALAEPQAASAVEGVPVLDCQACGAQLERPAEVTAEPCPYCGNAIVDDSRHVHRIRPQGLLPFRIDREAAGTAFEAWVRRLWFAPSDVRHCARQRDRLQGIYLPYWTYDAHAVTAYTGKRGEDYWDTESYTTRENGKTVTKTRRVRKTRWYSCRGVVGNRFDDLLVLASRNLPGKQARALEPWDLHQVEAYDTSYLSGFRAERYQVELDEGFRVAEELMQPDIRRSIERDIGGDRQRIHSSRTEYRQVTFKHLLLPVWMTAFRRGERVYRVLVNARTGEVQGERPWSAMKITIAVLAVIAVAVGVYFLARGSAVSA